MSGLQPDLEITSPSNQRVKDVVRLRQRSHRNSRQQMLIEGYREISRALDNGHPLTDVFFCETRFQGENNEALLERAREVGARLIKCFPSSFDKMAYRDRPDGLLALAPPVVHTLAELGVT